MCEGMMWGRENNRGLDIKRQRRTERIAMPRSQTLSLAASTDAHFLHANHPTNQPLPNLLKNHHLHTGVSSLRTTTFAHCRRHHPCRYRFQTPHPFRFFFFFKFHETPPITLFQLLLYHSSPRSSSTYTT